VPGGLLLSLADDVEDLLAGGLGADPEHVQGPAGHPIAVTEQPEQYVLGTDESVVQRPGFLLGRDDHLAGPRAEPAEHEISLAPAGSPEIG